MAQRIDQSSTMRVALKLYLSSDHVSNATGKTLAITISKNGAAFGNPNGGATNAVEIGNGWYYVDLNATDLGTVGPLIVRGTSASCDDSEIDFDVKAAWVLTEPTAVPAASPSFLAGMSWLFTLSRNKVTQTATTQILKADDGSTTIATSTLSDDGTTLTRGEFA